METLKAYTKPVLSRVDLRPEQTVLALCSDDTCWTGDPGDPEPTVAMGS